MTCELQRRGLDKIDKRKHTKTEHVQIKAAIDACFSETPDLCDCCFMACYGGLGADEFDRSLTKEEVRFFKESE